MRVFAILVSGFAIGWGSAAAAAEPARRTPPPSEPAMQVHVVRSAQAGCEPQCPEWIAAQGRIDAAALNQFKKVLGRLGQRKLPVLVDSGGGSVKDAFAIGRLVRAKGLDVVVTKTAYAPCAPTDAACRKSKTGGALLGMPQALFAKCASSCAFILAGGTRRLVGPSTFVGVHQISYFRILRTYRVLTRRAWGEPVKTHKTLISEQKIPQKTAPQSSYADIKHYFAEMGIGESIMPLITSTPSDKIHWLTRDQLRSTGLATDWMDGERLLAGAAAWSASVAGPAPAVIRSDLESKGSEAACGQFATVALACPSNLAPDDPNQNEPAVPSPDPAPAAPPE